MNIDTIKTNILRHVELQSLRYIEGFIQQEINFKDKNMRPMLEIETRIKDRIETMSEQSLRDYYEAHITRIAVASESIRKQNARK